MKMISWNCWGLGNPLAVRALLRLIRLENPHLVLLMETRMKEREVEKIRGRDGFNSELVVPCVGQGRERAGSLTLWWNDSLEISLSSFSQNHISGEVKDEEDDSPWFFSSVYGFLVEGQKRMMWELVKI